MADITVTINGVTTTLSDASTWINPLTGFVIDLTTPQGRQFLRAERDQLKVTKATLQEERDIALAGRDRAIAQRDAFIAARDQAVAELTTVNARIEEIRTFLTNVGDDPDT